MIRWDKANLKFKDISLFTDLDFSVERGDKVLINSKSGSGKSSLLKTALGLIQLDSGLIFINDVELSPETISSIRSQIFYLDQDVNLPEVRVEILMEEIFNYKENRDKILNKALLIELFDEFLLPQGILEKNIKELSGGERQRVGLIIGLLLDRPIWLLDEPTSALDKKLKEIVVNKILSLPITAVVVSHDANWDKLNIVSVGSL